MPARISTFMIHENEAYAVLGIPPGSPPDVVRRTFKRAVRRYHPDLHPNDTGAAEQLRRVVLAYRRLEQAGLGGTRARSERPPRPERAPRAVVICQIRGASFYGTLATRSVTAHADWVDLEIRALDACSGCRGRGYEEVPARFWRVERWECELCHGCGILRAERRVSVRVPPQATCIRLRGIGFARPGQPRGDAILTVTRVT